MADHCRTHQVYSQGQAVLSACARPRRAACAAPQSVPLRCDSSASAWSRGAAGPGPSSISSIFLKSLSRRAPSGRVAARAIAAVTESSIEVADVQTVPPRLFLLPLPARDCLACSNCAPAPIPTRRLYRPATAPLPSNRPLPTFTEAPASSANAETCLPSNRHSDRASLPLSPLE